MCNDENPLRRISTNEKEVEKENTMNLKTYLYKTMISFTPFQQAVICNVGGVDDVMDWSMATILRDLYI